MEEGKYNHNASKMTDLANETGCSKAELEDWVQKMTNNQIIDEAIGNLRQASGKRQLLLAQVHNETIENAIQRIQDSNVQV
ncbi:hypothetical protein HPULCUR_007494 [Helicostylum pulchrum]|uniref:Uncharacterized protein n=1 Tax=Helicostylum pulchrum TaxID=562976 RepID=A0ABP9Y4Y2_9FUNG